MQRGMFGFATALVLGCMWVTITHAEERQGCLRIEEKRQIEQQHVDAQGHASVQRRDATSASRGQTLLFTLKATNVCDTALDPAVISFALPERFTYALGSANAAGAEIVFSINGKSYGKFDSLAIHDAGGPRAARSEDIKYIRWILRKPLAPNAGHTTRFRATAQ